MIAKPPSSDKSGDSCPIRTYWLTGGAAAIIVALIAAVVAIKPWSSTSSAVPPPTPPTRPAVSPSPTPTVQTGLTSPQNGADNVPYRVFSDPKTVDASAVAFSPDSKTLAVADVNGGAFLWNVPGDSFIAGLYSPKGQSVWDVAYSPNGSMVADGTSNAKTYNNGSVYLWSVASPAEPIATFPDPQGAGVAAIAFSPDGKLLAAADGNGTIYLLNATTLKVAGKVQGPAPGSGYAIDGLAFSPDGSELAGAANDGSVYAWNVATRTLITGPLYDPDHQDAKGIAFSPNGALVAVADTNGSAYLWNLVSGEVLKTFHDPAGLQVIGVAFTLDGNALVTTSQSGKYNHDSAVRVWNATTGTLIHSFYDPGSYGAGRLAISQDGQLLAVADDDAHAYVWRLNWLRVISPGGTNLPPVRSIQGPARGKGTGSFPPS